VARGWVMAYVWVESAHLTLLPGVMQAPCAGRGARGMLIEYGIARRKPAMPRPIRLVRPTLLAAALCAANLALGALPASVVCARFLQSTD